MFSFQLVRSARDEDLLVHDLDVAIGQVEGFFPRFLEKGHHSGGGIAESSRCISKSLPFRDRQAALFNWVMRICSNDDISIRRCLKQLQYPGSAGRLLVDGRVLKPRSSALNLRATPNSCNEKGFNFWIGPARILFFAAPWGIPGLRFLLWPGPGVGSLGCACCRGCLRHSSPHAPRGVL